MVSIYPKLALWYLGQSFHPPQGREYQLINSCKACWCMLYAWIYRENNTRDPCEHRKDQPAHHSKKGLMPPCGWRHYTQARSCLGRVDPGPEPSLSQAGDEGPAWRREEAPSRASPVSNQKRTEGRTPTAVKGRPKTLITAQTVFGQQRPPSNQAVEGEQG